MKGRKLRGYRLFNAVRGQNVLQVVFLNLALPIVVTNILRKYGCNLRNEFKSNIAHAHSTLLSDREFFLLKEWQKELVRKLGEVILEVEIIGIIAISNENDICLGLEVEVPGNKELRDKFKYACAKYSSVHQRVQYAGGVAERNCQEVGRRDHRGCQEVGRRDHRG